MVTDRGIDESRTMITRVRVENFRSIRSCDVRLGPLTVLVGPNASGKSNFMDSIHFLRDALDWGVEPALWERGGLDEVLHRSEDFSMGGSFSTSVTLEKSDEDGAVIAAAEYGIEISRRPDGGFVVEHEHLDPAGDWERLRFRRTSTPAGEYEVEFIDFPPGIMQPDSPLLRFLAGYMQIERYKEISDLLASMRFYDLHTPTLRSLDQTPRAQRGSRLGSQGEHLGHVLGLLKAEHPLVKDNIDAFLAGMVQNAEGIDQLESGRDARYSEVEGRFIVAGDRFNDPQVRVFGRDSLSEGTLRLAGILVALFQPGVLNGSIPFVGLEEPEKALHPPTLGGLYEALDSASTLTQVMVTTQSADLLNNEFALPSHLVAVKNVQGRTVVGPVKESVLALIEDGTMTLAELVRDDFARPAVPDISDGPAGGSNHELSRHSLDRRGPRRIGSGSVAVAAYRRSRCT